MTEPIIVPQSAKPDLIGQAVRYGIVAAASAAASWAFHDAVVTGAVLAFATALVAAVPAVGAYVWGFWTTLRQHRRNVKIADAAPNTVAVVVK